MSLDKLKRYDELDTQFKQRLDAAAMHIARHIGIEDMIEPAALPFVVTISTGSGPNRYNHSNNVVYLNEDATDSTIYEEAGHGVHYKYRAKMGIVSRLDPQDILANFFFKATEEAIGYYCCSLSNDSNDASFQGFQLESLLSSALAQVALLGDAALTIQDRNAMKKTDELHSLRSITFLAVDRLLDVLREPTAISSLPSAESAYSGQVLNSIKQKFARELVPQEHYIINAALDTASTLAASSLAALDIYPEARQAYAKLFYLTLQDNNGLSRVFHHYGYLLGQALVELDKTSHEQTARDMRNFMLVRNENALKDFLFAYQKHGIHFSSNSSRNL